LHRNIRRIRPTQQVIDNPQNERTQRFLRAIVDREEKAA
jgi:hypothetical protein